MIVSQILAHLDFLDEAIALAKKTQANHCLADCFLIRALAHALRKEDPAAEQAQEFEQKGAHRFSPQDAHAAALAHAAGSLACAIFASGSCKSCAAIAIASAAGSLL